MPRPFRSQPPSMSASTIERRRLLDVVQRRWEVRVVSIVAGPGFGKTSLLSQAWAEEVPVNALQVWLTCEPADSSLEHLRASLAAAIDLPPLSETRVILDALWARSPDPVCLMFDDVHELPAGSPGAKWLADFVGDMSANVHVVLCGREQGRVPVSRLAVSGQVLRITEADLLFTADELAEFGQRRGADQLSHASTGGWPALAELAANTGDDLRIDFLWDEVLERVGPVRSLVLAQLSACGGGDDEIIRALSGRDDAVDDIVRDVPLASQWSQGWVTLHPLWQPALRRVLPPTGERAARTIAGEVHRRRGRYSWALQLLAEAEAWEDVFAVIAEAERSTVFFSTSILHRNEVGPLPHDFDRWYRLIPVHLRDEPAALLARGLGMQATEPLTAADFFRRAAAGFKAAGNPDGQLAAISHEGIVRWWSNDMVGLFTLYLEVGELVAAGVERGRALAAVGAAAIAHLNGDSTAVLDALADVDENSDRSWLPSVHWLRSVAHRRDGELVGAMRELDRVESGMGLADPQIDLARLRVRWLQGEVDDVAEALTLHHQQVAVAETGFLVREAAWEAAARLAWLGDIDAANALVASAPALDDMPSVLVDVLEAITTAAIAIDEGDEPTATRVLAEAAGSGEAALDRPASWYWRDRAAAVALRVLVPDLCAPWADRPSPGAHEAADRLATVVAAARSGDTDPVSTFEWPPAGIVRAHLPRRWVSELVALALAVGNPPPPELLACCDAPAADGGRSPATPRVGISVLGPLALRVDGERAEPPQLRRARVRELICYLIAFGRVRREVVATDLWPDATDPGHNLRVTLNYLKQAMDHATNGSGTSAVSASAEWLHLDGADRASVDVWALVDQLDAAESAERAVDISSALAHYARLLPLWTGEPYADVAYAAWAEPPRSLLRRRYVAAALRAGELWLSGGNIDDARRAAERALVVDQYCEPAHRLVVRSHLAAGHPSAAREAYAGCLAALADLGVMPDPLTAGLLSTLDEPRG